MPDFTRSVRSQREQAVGQMVALPHDDRVRGDGVIITSAAMVIYPDMPAGDVWDPVKVVGRFDQAWVVAVSMFTVVVATLSGTSRRTSSRPRNDFARIPEVDSFGWADSSRAYRDSDAAWRLLADPRATSLVAPGYSAASAQSRGADCRLLARSRQNTSRSPTLPHARRCTLTRRLELARGGRGDVSGGALAWIGMSCQCSGRLMITRGSSVRRSFHHTLRADENRTAVASTPDAASARAHASKAA